MAQRLRLTFARRGAASFLSHLEMMRAWERVLRRAGWRPARSQGFNPHPKLFFAAPLPVGVATEADLLEVHLEEPRAPEAALEELACHMPPGVEVRRVEEVPEEAPLLQRSMAAAEYLALCPEVVPPDLLQREVDRVLAAASLPRERRKEGKTVAYDLRPMVQGVAVEEGEGRRPAVRMRLRTDAQGAGRPDEVLRELGLDPAECRITRLRLVLSEAATASGRA